MYWASGPGCNSWMKSTIYCGSENPVAMTKLITQHSCMHVIQTASGLIWRSSQHKFASKIKRIALDNALTRITATMVTNQWQQCWCNRPMMSVCQVSSNRKETEESMLWPKDRESQNHAHNYILLGEKYIQLGICHFGNRFPVQIWTKQCLNTHVASDSNSKTFHRIITFY